MRLRPLVLRHSIGLLAGISILAAMCPLQSQATPLPRPRPAGKSAPPPQPPANAPATRPVVPSDDADLDPDHPPVLPPAPRAKMHACGREWQDMKRRGVDRNQTWRQFATACLQRN